MVWKKMFPPNGGGGIRRFVRIRKDLINNYRNTVPLSASIDSSIPSSSSSLSSPLSSPSAPPSKAMEEYSRKYMKPLTIFDFKNYDDAADARAVSYGTTKGGWRISDDEVIGGYSRGSLQLIEHNNDKDDDVNNDDSDEQQQQQQQQPFIRWTGNVDTRIGPKSRAKRSGFCAMRCPQYPFGIPLGSRYNALEINCRTDGRIYTVNLRASSYFPDDLYQALITVDESTQTKIQNEKKGKGKNNDSSEFLTLVMPFADFLLTSDGLIRANQRYLDGGIKLEHIGFTIMDGKDGPFQFDLARIRAVNFEDGVIIGDDQ